MENELITLETAKLAKEKGFNEKGEYYYLSSDYDILMGLDRTGYNMYPTKKNSDGKGSIIVVTQSLLQKWLREEHEILLCIEYSLSDDNWFFYIYKADVSLTHYKTYEDALEAGLKIGLKLIKDA